MIKIESDLSIGNQHDGIKEHRGSNMKWFDRALSAFLAGILFLFAIQIIYASFSGLLKGISVTAVGIIIVGIAIFLFFIGYKGRSPF